MTDTNFLIARNVHWHRGNYSEAYEGNQPVLAAWCSSLRMDHISKYHTAAFSEDDRAVMLAEFILGFYASYEEHEIPVEDNEIYKAARSLAADTWDMDREQAEKLLKGNLEES